MSLTNTPAMSYMPTLVVDANGPAAKQLTDQLRHSGFPADIAITCPAAHAATRARSYGSTSDLIARLLAFSRRSRPP